MHGAHEWRRDVGAKLAWQSTQRGYRWRRLKKPPKPGQTAGLANKGMPPWPIHGNRTPLRAKFDLARTKNGCFRRSRFHFSKAFRPSVGPDSSIGIREIQDMIATVEHLTLTAGPCQTGQRTPNPGKHVTGGGDCPARRQPNYPLDCPRAFLTPPARFWASGSPRIPACGNTTRTVRTRSLR